MQIPVSHQRDSGVIDLGLGKGLRIQQTPQEILMQVVISQTLRIPMY